MSETAFIPSKKRCSKCGQVKPIAEFPYWRRKRDGTRVPRNECRACRLGVPEDHKRCSMRAKCAHPDGAVQPLDAFDDDDARADGKCPRCQTCVEVYGSPGTYPPLSAQTRSSNGKYDPLSYSAWWPVADNGLWVAVDRMTDEQQRLRATMEQKRIAAGWYD